VSGQCRPAKAVAEPRKLDHSFLRRVGLKRTPKTAICTCHGRLRQDRNYYRHFRRPRPECLRQVQIAGTYGATSCQHGIGGGGPAAAATPAGEYRRALQPTAPNTLAWSMRKQPVCLAVA
jgi:hypothetical protein